MDPLQLRSLLDDLARGRLTVADAERRLATLPFEQIDAACLDHHRGLRCGLPEVVFAEGKTPAQVEQIVDRLAERGANVLATRVSADVGRALMTRHPTAQYHALGRVLTIERTPPTPAAGKAAVVCAGTSDMPVAEEARVTLAAMGVKASSFSDVGVAGLHRLLHRLDELRSVDVAIVIAGMEGALPSVVGGLLACPIVAVPTSVGYGASFGGLAALLAMLNSCAAGVAVVNIDNGFGAAVHAGKIAQRVGPPANAFMEDCP